MFIKYNVYKNINTENVTNVTIVNTYNVCTYAQHTNFTVKIVYISSTYICYKKNSSIVNIYALINTYIFI